MRMNFQLVIASLFISTLLSAKSFSDDQSKPGSNAAPAAPIDYNRQIRPLLSNYCFRCHGPDANERQSGLRLDIRAEALKPAESGKPAIVPEMPEKSRLVERIFSNDPSEVMPPPEFKKKLADGEKQLLKAWVAQGAKYQQHWSFISPQRPALPGVKNTKWARNDIDRFILAQLEAAGLQPSPEADRTTLIRRVTLDLTGLPPAPAEVDAFLADKSVNAYEKVVERLLDSPHYGERMAVDWLDAARFADTNGYHIDNGRDMTRWREWVINSFNRNLPFDQFTVEQLAGDLLPNPTRDQLIASGFNRNHMINFEGGAIPEEYHTAYIVDRINTTSTVWLGLTLGCTQCHDHKYDPFTQREFYQLFAFFNNVDEKGLDGYKGNSSPLIKFPTSEQQQRLDQVAADIQKLEQQLAGALPAVDAAQIEWEKAALSDSQITWSPLDVGEMHSKGGATLKKLDDKSILVSGENPNVETYTVTAKGNLKEITAIRVEALPDDSLADKGPGRSSNGNIVMTDVRLTVPGERGGVSPPVASQKFKSSSADFSQKDFPVANAIDADPKTGWAIHPEVGKPHAAVFELEQPIRSEEGTLLTVTLDFQSAYGQHQFGRFRVSITGAKNPHGTGKLPDNVSQALAVSGEKRSDEQRAVLKNYYRTNVSAETKPMNEQLAALRKSQTDIDQVIPTAMVMKELEKPRDTFMLVRGQYDKKGDKVPPGVPTLLSPLPDGAPLNRLGMAQWLVHASHPLTSRVIVNRYWQMFFGIGLVKTTEDFGSQGESPSHPELLDWLAVEFMSPSPSDAKSIGGATPSNPPSLRGGEHASWDVKSLVRLLVTSAAYRQTSRITPELLSKDPENRLLARGPRFRLQAEFIRDHALAASGLLNRKIGGQSVSPYQPPGLWEELMSRADGKNWTAQTYEQSHGADLYRRTMYTFWKRTCPPPTLATFDAPDRETCTVRRARTNTPLQALILLNDPTYVEAARKLAERIVTEGGQTADERITFAFRMATARKPTARETAVLSQILQQQQARFANDKSAVEKLLAVGESSRNETLDAIELAAWTTIASMILNLDETVTRG